MLYTLFSGRVAERPIASVLKTEGPKGSGGSNPSSSVLFHKISKKTSGRVAEWPIASVSKTDVGQPTVGSNPTSSDLRLALRR